MSTTIAFVIACLALQRPVEAPATLADELRTACEDFRATTHSVGLSVAVLRDGELVLDAAFGQRDREANLAAEPATLYRLGSIAKPVTAVLVMRLVERKKLELDTGLSQYVDELDAPIAALTLRQLLSHTSGVRHYAPGRPDNGTQHYTTREALELFAHDPLIAAPGEKYSYSTHAFTLIAAAVESASKRDFAAQVAHEIGDTAPALRCEIASETKAARSALYSRNALGLVVRSEPREDLSWKYAGGGMESTALDLARFAQAVLDAKLVSADSRELLWTRSKLADGSPIDYGLGWGIPADNYGAAHTGSQQGASSSLAVLRKDKCVIAVLCNTEGGVRELAGKLRELCARER